MMQANWAYVVIGLCILLAAFLLWQEYGRTNKKRLGLRLAAVLLAVIGLACIAMPIGYQKDNTLNQDEQFILLTDGFKTDSLKDNPAQKVFTIDGDVKKAYPKATLLSGLDELADTVKQQPLHIYGFGLSTPLLKQLDSVNLVFHPSPIPQGVSHISWNKNLRAGDELRVQGSYNNPSAQKVKLLLKGLNTVLDTLTLKQGTRSDFELSVRPKTVGRLVYTLQSVLNGDSTNVGSIPSQIDAVKPVRVLMLSAAPSFEAKFLKNWLGQNGYAVTSRSAISKDKFNSEFINTSQIQLDRLSASVLNKFDVVIGDLSTLNNLNGTEAAILKQEVENNGLGIIVRADSTGKTTWLQHDFPQEKTSEKEVLAPLTVNGQKSTSAKLNIGNTFIRYQNGMQPLAVAQSRIVASSAINDLGKIVFSTLGNTYTWALGGNQNDYTMLWSALISKAARRDTTVQQSIETDGLPVAEKQVQLRFTQNKAELSYSNNEAIAAEQNPAIPFEWNAQFIPAQAGWQTLGKLYWYAYTPNEWITIQAAEKIADTRQFAGEHQSDAIVTKQIHQKIRIEVPKIYFYILLLAAFMFLWVERKMV